MSPAVRSVLALAVTLVVAIVVLRPGAPPGATAAAQDFAAPSAASRARGLAWDGVSPADRQAILGAIADARPEARRLIAEVSGLITVRVGPAGPGEAGSTLSTTSGYELQLDLAGVSGVLGPRGVDRLVLHELGHVVDGALVSDALRDALDDEIPVGYGCRRGAADGCTSTVERFAETFAKWAMDDIGLSLDIGYKVPPPSVPLATWGSPLVALR